MSQDIQALTEHVKENAAFVADIRREIARVIVGMNPLVDRLLIGLLSNGHVLLEGVPGLAKTTCVKTLSDTLHTHFQRIQFTPDLLPADLLGTQIFNQRDGSFEIKKGPLFANLILADEINRAPAKVQSALLEAMQERQITIGGQTFPLPEPFLVLATQNPIEQEGTYPLPEAQVDRFMLKVRITYPAKAEELEILKRMARVRPGERAQAVVTPETVLKARDIVDEIYIDEKVQGYIVDIVTATRQPGAYNLKDLEPFIQYGASPRATIYLAMAARAMAFLQGRGYVVPQDIKSIGADVLRHRVITTYEAEAEEIGSEEIVRRIFDTVEVP